VSGPAGERPPTQSRRASLGVIFGVVFLDLLGFGILIPQLGVYAVQFKASAIEVGTLGSVYSLMQFAGAPFFGRLSDRVGRRPVLLITMVFSFFSYVLFGFAGSMLALWVSRIMAGLAGANISTAQAYISDITTPENRGRGMAMIGIAFGLGFVLGPALGGILGSWHGNAAIGAVCAGLTLLNLVFAIFFLPESLTESARAAGKTNKGTWLQRVRTPGIGVALTLGFLVTAAFAQVEGTFSIFLLSRFLSPDAQVTASLFELSAHVDEAVLKQASFRAGMLFTVIGVVSIVIQGGLLNRLRPMFGEVRLVRGGLMIFGLGVILTPLAPSYAWMFPAVAVMALGSSLVNPSMASLMSQLSPPDRQGELLGTYQSMGALGRIVGPSLGGIWFTIFSPRMPFFVAGGILWLAALLALRLNVPSPKK